MYYFFLFEQRLLQTPLSSCFGKSENLLTFSEAFSETSNKVKGCAVDSCVECPSFLYSHLQHQTVPLLQVHRKQRRGQISAQGQRTEEDPPGNRRY